MSVATARRGMITVDSPVPAVVYRFMARAPGYKRWTDSGGCKFEASRAHVAALKSALEQNPGAFTLVDADGTLAALDKPLLPIEAHKRMLGTGNGKPWAHQDRAHNIMMSREYYGFWFDMGTGKSATIAQGAAELHARGKIERALVVSTGRGWQQFINDQAPYWLPQDIEYRIARLPQQLKRFQFPGNALLIGVATPGAFQSKAQSAKLLEFCKGGKTAIFVDESQNFKGWSSQRVDNLLKLAPHTTHRFLFSGEPQPHGPEDLFAQFYFMDPNIIGHSSKTSFEKYFCVKEGYQVREITEYVHLDELTELVAPHCEYLKITDCLDMPERSWREVKWQPTQQQVDVYEQLKHAFVVDIEAALNDSKNIELIKKVCKNSATRLVTMAQVSNGWFYKDNELDQPRDIVHLSDERAYFTLEELMGTSKKCIVWARFHEDLEQLQRAAKELGIDAVEFSGRIGSKQAEANKQRFTFDDKCRGFFGTAATGGSSLDGLQVANRAIYYSNSYNYGDRAQSERRIWRAGQREHCEYIDVVGFPVDRAIRRNIKDKRDLSGQVQTLVGLAQLVKEL